MLALYLALKHIAKNTMLLATGLMAVFVIVDVAITEANQLTLVTLTQHAATAVSATQRAASMAAANYALATLPLATFYSWVVSSIGVLIISIVMLKGVFGKLTASLYPLFCRCLRHFQKTKHLDLSQHCFDGTDHGTHSL